MSLSIRDSRTAALASRHLHFGFVALVALCTGCELVMGDIPEKPAAGAAGNVGSSGGGSGTSGGAGGAVGSGGTTPGSGGAAVADAANEGCCDCDGDTVYGTQCNGNDCDDANSDAHPNQMMFFPTARQAGSFDYNCNNSIEQEPRLDCATLGGVLCATTTQGFLKPWPACGQSGMWGYCEMGVPCAQHILETRVMGCH